MSGGRSGSTPTPPQVSYDAFIPKPPRPPQLYSCSKGRGFKLCYVMLESNVLLIIFISVYHGSENHFRLTYFKMFLIHVFLVFLY